MRRRGWRIAAILCAFVTMLLAWGAPAHAWADGDVAKVEGIGYGSLDDAVAAAQSGGTIEILADCTSAGLNLNNKPLTFVGSAEEPPTISFDEEGICAHDSSITFENCIVEMTVSENPGHSGGTANLLANSDLSLANSTLSIVNDEADTAGESGLYLYQNSNLNLKGSSMEVESFNDAKESSGIFCDNSEYSGKSNRKIVLEDRSSLTVTNCGWHGLTVNPVDITVDGESSLRLSGNGNQEYGGGLGCYYGKLTVRNNSEVVASNNPGTGWGIFVRDIEVDGTSALQACNNGGDGIDVGGKGIFRAGAQAAFSGNASTGLRVYMSGSWVGDVTVEGKASITANSNAGYGIRNNNLFTVKSGAVVVACDNGLSGFGVNQAAAKTLVEAGADVSLLRNRDGGVYNAGTLEMYAGEIMLNTTTLGGGLYNAGTATLGPDVAVYNNHASRSGDDLFNKDSAATLIFGKVASGWLLDGVGIDGIKDDCTDAIDGWYDDSENARWEAHADSEDENHAVEFDKFDLNNMATVEGLLALKAAHGLEPLKPGEEGSDTWEKSKSKTATNLDENYESEVTLSLPAKEEQLVSDVVLVLDKSTSNGVRDQAVDMLKDLKDQVDSTDAVVRVGIVVFNKDDHRELELTTLSDENMEKIETAINTKQSGGTNTHAGLSAGKAMLDEDNSVAANRKFLVFVSDAITYIFDDEGNATSIVSEQYEWNAGNVVSTKDMTYTGAAMKYPYKTNIFGNKGVEAYLEKVGKLIDNDGDKYWVGYESEITDQTPTLKSNVNEAGVKTLDDETFESYVGNDWVNNHANNLDTALYLTSEVYHAAKAEGYHCYAMKATETSYAEGDYPWSDQFMDYLAGGEEVSFGDIQKDIYYLLDKGSKVVDVIGYGTDDHGNDYNFDFVNDVDRLTLTVGGQPLSKEPIVDPQMTDPYVTDAYGFFSGNESNQQYDFELYYYEKGQDGNSDECFVWKINVPVSNFAPVQLTYAVKLANPQTEEGTYGRYDENGTQNYGSLYTNHEATLYPVDSNGEEGRPELFRKPTVSYKVDEPWTPDPDPQPKPEPKPDPEPEPEEPKPSDPINPGGEKDLVDSNGKALELTAGQFTFQLVGHDGAPMPEGSKNGVATVANAKDGTIAFGDIVFTKEGTYTYTLSEVMPADEDPKTDGVQNNGVTYDPTSYTLTVVVKDSNDDGKLDVTSLLYNGKAALPVFTNTGTPEEPVEPVEPENPETPTKPIKPEETLPSTGDIALGVVSAVAGVGIVCLGISFALKKRRE